MTGCGCDGGCGTGGVDVARRVEQWRVSPYAAAVQRMRDDLAAGAAGRPPALRGLARHVGDDPAIALLDAWAVVADIVSFYTERIAQEGFLRTATETRSVRELARTLGYELRPGVAGQVELAFEAETAAGAPETVAVPKGTPVQSIPGQDESPQTFETTDDLEVRGIWNALAGRAGVAQTYSRATTEIWLAATSTTVRAGDHVLVVGDERIAYGLARADRRPALGRDAKETWDFRTVQAVSVAPDGRAGWIRLDLDARLGHSDDRPLIAKVAPKVFTFIDRTRLFGFNAPDPSMLGAGENPPPGSSSTSGDDTPTKPRRVWAGFEDLGDTDRLELDGDHASVRADTWLVLEQPSYTEAVRVERADADGQAKWGMTGPVTRVRVDVADDLHRFQRRRVKIHCGSMPVPADNRPTEAPITGTTLEVAACDPPPPPDRLVMITGRDAATGLPASESATLVVAEPTDPGWLRLTLSAPLHRTYLPDGLVVRANVVAATHGETVRQVLGSGGNVPFQRFVPRRTPLTYVRAPVAEGAAAELDVRVSEVAWQEVPGLDQAGPSDRVYAVRRGEDGVATITFGDGVHGARVPTGSENVAATYRVGIGAPGGVRPGQVSLLTRRPLGIRGVGNPAAAHDWAPPEGLDEARVNAPLRVRTFARAVSVEDHADFARTYAGIGPARADLVWNGRGYVVVVTVLGTAGADPSAGLITDLRMALLAARDPGHEVEVLPGDVIDVDVRVAVAHDPAYLRDVVVADVTAVVCAAYGRPVRTLSSAVTSAEVLVAVRGVPGVVACTMPVLSDSRTVRRRRRAGVLTAEPGRHDPARGLLPAQLLAVSAVTVTEFVG